MEKTMFALLILFSMIFMGDILLGKDGNTILKKITDAQNYKTMESEAMMIVYKGKKETAKMKMKSYLKKGDEDRQLMRYKSPKRLAGTAILMNADKTWYYNKRTNRVRLLSESAKNGSMMGSSFSYDDMSLDYDKDFRAEILQEKKKYYILKLFPKKTKKYRYLIIKVYKENYTEDYIEYYDKNEILYKTLINKRMKKIQGIFVALEIEMKERANSKSTRIIVDEQSIKLNGKINDKFFSERNLRQ